VTGTSGCIQKLLGNRGIDGEIGEDAQPVFELLKFLVGTNEWVVGMAHAAPPWGSGRSP